MNQPARGSDIPAAPGPVTDQFWTGGGCGHMALAFHNLWPDLKIGAEIDDKDGTVNHAWVHDGQRAHDGAGREIVNTCGLGCFRRPPFRCADRRLTAVAVG